MATAAAAAARKGRVSAELTSLAAGYLVSLFKEPEVAQELWPLITRCMDNVAARRSVPASLEVLRRAIATLPAHEAKSWFGGSRSKENRWVDVGACTRLRSCSEKKKNSDRGEEDEQEQAYNLSSLVV